MIFVVPKTILDAVRFWFSMQKKVPKASLLSSLECLIPQSKM
jgi:hypothetical protein